MTESRSLSGVEGVGSFAALGLGLQEDRPGGPHGGCSGSPGAKWTSALGGWERTQSKSHKKTKWHLPKGTPAAPHAKCLAVRQRKGRVEERTTGRRKATAARTWPGVGGRGGGAEGVWWWGRK